MILLDNCCIGTPQELKEGTTEGWDSAEERDERGFIVSNLNWNKVSRSQDDGIGWKRKAPLRYAQMQYRISNVESAPPPNLPAL